MNRREEPQAGIQAVPCHSVGHLSFPAVLPVTRTVLKAFSALCRKVDISRGIYHSNRNKIKTKVLEEEQGMNQLGYLIKKETGRE